MILRDEIDEKVIITNKIDINWWETNTYAITDEGFLWLDRQDSHSEGQAKARHEKAISKYKPQEIHICKYCAEVALTYWSLTQSWMCSHHFYVMVVERA